MSELEVLNSIYGDNLEVQSPSRFRMKFSPYVGNERDHAYAFLLLDFTIPEAYPKAVPQVTIVSQKGLDEDRVTQFQATLTRRYATPTVYH